MIQYLLTPLPLSLLSYAFFSTFNPQSKWQSGSHFIHYSHYLQVTPLTALKFAELSVKAGIPKGVINILPGSGNEHKDTIHRVLNSEVLFFPLSLSIFVFCPWCHEITERYEWEIVSQNYNENLMVFLQASGSWHDSLVIQSKVCVKIPIPHHSICNLKAVKSKSDILISAS